MINYYKIVIGNVWFLEIQTNKIISAHYIHGQNNTSLHKLSRVFHEDPIKQIRSLVHIIYIDRIIQAYCYLACFFL